VVVGGLLQVAGAAGEGGRAGGLVGTARV